MIQLYIRDYNLKYNVIYIQYLNNFKDITKVFINVYITKLYIYYKEM